MTDRINVAALREYAAVLKPGEDTADLEPSELVALVEAVEEEYRLGDYKTKDRLEARFDFGEPA